MRDDLKTVLQAAIRLDVNVFLMHIGDAFEAGGVVVVLAAFIHFQFHAKVSLSVSVENGCGLVTVFLDLVFKLVEASFAVGQVAVPADEAFRNDLPAGFAAVVVGIKTVLAEAGIFIGNAVLFPDRLTAVVAGDAVFLNTVIAEQLIVYRRALFLCKLSSAVVTNILTSSSISSSSKNKKIPVRLKDSPYRNYNIYLIFGVDTGEKSDVVFAAHFRKQLVFTN